MPLLDLRRPAIQRLSDPRDKLRVDQHQNDNIDRLNTAFAYFEEGFVHGEPTLFANPFGPSSTKQPIALFSGIAEDSSGNTLGIISYKIGAPRTDGQIEVTIEFDQQHTEPSAEFTRTSGQALGASTEVPIQWQTSSISGSVISLVSNSRITFSEAGLYSCSGTVGFAATAGNSRAVFWRENSDAADYGNLQRGLSCSPDTDYQNTSVIRTFSAGDYVELVALQTTAGSINTVATYTRCQVARLRNDTATTGTVRGFLLADKP